MLDSFVANFISRNADGLLVGIILIVIEKIIGFVFLSKKITPSSYCNMKNGINLISSFGPCLTAGAVFIFLSFNRATNVAVILFFHVDLL